MKPRTLNPRLWEMTKKLLKKASSVEDCVMDNDVAEAIEEATFLMRDVAEFIRCANRDLHGDG